MWKNSEKKYVLTGNSNMTICLPFINDFHHFFGTGYKPFCGSLRTTAEANYDAVE